MLDFEFARQRFLDVAPILGHETQPTDRALGRVLAESVHARRAVPEFDTSAMDGYALRAEDCPSLPYRLNVEGEAPAGAARSRLRVGTAMRIFTGAAVPEGADTVVMQEHVRRDGAAIVGERPLTRGQNIRRQGEDLPAMAVALERGQRISAGALGLLSFLDCAAITVAKSPRVTLLCTGSELRAPGSEGRPGSISESNSPVVEALARQAGATILERTIVHDEVHALEAAVEHALKESDLLITIGGVSVGDYDLVRPALISAGFELEVQQVRIKPGKPITLGHRNEKLAIGLPGNPLSAVVTFALFGMPLLRAMQGDAQPIPLPLSVPVMSPLKRDAAKTRIVIGSVSRTNDNAGFVPHANQTSGSTLALGQSDGFVIVEPGAASTEVGATLPFHRWTDL